MRILLIISLLSVLTFSSDAENYPFIKKNQVLYSEIDVNIDGDESIDKIVLVIEKNEFNAMKQDELFLAGITEIYFVINGKNFIRLDNSRFYAFILQMYNDLSNNTVGSQLGEVEELFYLKDFNNNGKDEIYFIEYVNEFQYFTGYEFINGGLKKIIDVDINGYYKKNFLENESGELNLLRGFSYEKPYERISPDLTKRWKSFFRFDIDSSEYKEVRTEAIEVPKSDFF